MLICGAVLRRRTHEVRRVRLQHFDDDGERLHVRLDIRLDRSTIPISTRGHEYVDTPSGMSRPVIRLLDGREDVMGVRMFSHDRAATVSVPDAHVAVALYTEHGAGRVASERKDDQQRSQRPCERPRE